MLGVPTIRIWGALLVPAMLVVLYILWNDPNVGIGHAPLQKWLNIGLPLRGLVVYAAIWAWRRARRVDLRLAARDPPD